MKVSAICTGALATALLAGCATTPEGLIADKPPMRIYESSKAPVEIVQCMSEKLGLPAEARNGAWSVSSRNQFGIVINWFIKPTETGSSVELRRTQSMAPGIALAEQCF